MAKRILIITQFFDPEPTFKGLLFARELVARGYSVEVMTGFPNYPGGKVYPGHKIKLINREVIDGVEVTRLPLYPSHNKNKLGRLFNYFSFAFSVLIYGSIFAKRPNVIYAYHPPLTVGLSAVIIKFFRRLPVVLDIQDMWPDTLKATGMFSNKFLLKFVGRICNLLYSTVNKIIVLSPGFKDLLKSRGVPADKITVIYNWADEEVLRSPFSEVPEEISKIKGFKILFAGNIGKAQGLNVVLDAALKVKDEYPNLNFVIMGQGLMLDDLKNRAKKSSLTNVHFLPAVNMDKVNGFLKSADALLIHLNDDPLFKITIPGKTQAYLAVGKPIILGVSGDAKTLVSEAKCGFFVEPGNADQLANISKKIMTLSKNELENLGDNASSYYDKNLCVRVGVDAFSEVFNDVINKNL